MVLVALTYLRCLLRACIINEINVKTLRLFVAELRESVGNVVVNKLMGERSDDVSQSLFVAYMQLLLELFSTERKIGIYIPVVYGEKAEVGSHSNMNVSLKKVYFGDNVPSTFACLFNKRPSLLARSGGEDAVLEDALQKQVDLHSELAIPLSLERLVLLDTYAKADRGNSIREGCRRIVHDLFDRCLSKTEEGVEVVRCCHPSVCSPTRTAYSSRSFRFSFRIWTRLPLAR